MEEGQGGVATGRAALDPGQAVLEAVFVRTLY